MLLEEFDKDGIEKISRFNDFLFENYDLTISKNKFPRRSTLEKLRENAANNLIKIKGSKKEFHLEPEYAKFLGIKNIAEQMINEGVYDSSDRFRTMRRLVTDGVRSSLKKGKSIQETIENAVQTYKQNTDYAFNNEYTIPVVKDAIKKYLKVTGNTEMLAELAPADNEFSELEPAPPVGSDADLPIDEPVDPALDGVEPPMAGPEPAGANPEAPSAATSDAAISSIDEARVILAMREILTEIRDMVEKFGRLQNEDLVAIIDQMMSEYGARVTNKFKERANEVFAPTLDTLRQSADEFDNLINIVIGVEKDDIEVELDFDPKGAPAPEADPSVVDINEPPMAGPEEEPLGRAAVELE